MNESIEILKPLDIIISEEESEDSKLLVDLTDNKNPENESNLAVKVINPLLLSTQHSAPITNQEPIVVQTRKHSQSFLMTYSAGAAKHLPKLKMEIDPRLVAKLQSSPKPIPRRPSARRSNLPSFNKSPNSGQSVGPLDCLPILDIAASSNVSMSASSFLSPVKPRKKVRFANQVIIHRISVHKGSAPAPPPETFRLIISLKEIWQYLDLDKDKYLNMRELRRFADEVWENEDLDEMMKSYAQHPNKGLSFGEWCAVMKEEEGDIDDLLDDLYDIFVEDSVTEYDEKEDIVERTLSI